MSVTILVRRVRAFLFHYSSIFLPVLKSQPWKLTMITVADFFGVLSKASIVGLIAFFLNSLQSDHQIIIPYIGISFDGNMSAIYVLSGLVFVVSLLGAISHFYSAVWAREVGRHVHVYFGNKALVRISSGRARLLDEKVLSRGNVVKQVMRDSVHIGLAVENIIHSIRPIFYFVMGTIAALYLDAFMTLILAPMVLLLLPTLQKISSAIHRSSKSYFQQDVSNYSKELSQAIGVSDSSSFDGIDLSLEQISGIEAYLDGFDRNRLANERMMVFTSSFQSLLIAVAILVVGWNVFEGRLSWGEMLAYIMAVYYVFSSFQQISAYVVNLSRFFPQVLNYMRLEAGYDNRSVFKPDEHTGSEEFEVHPIRVNELENSDWELHIRLGSFLFYVSDQKPGRLNYGHFIAPLIGGSSIPSEWLVTADFIASFNAPFSRSMVESMTDYIVHGDHEEPLIESVLSQMLVAEEVARLGGLKVVLSEGGWNRASKPLKAVLHLLPILISEHPLAFVDIGMIKALSSDQMRELTRYIANKVIYCVTNGVAFLSKSISDQVVVAIGRDVVGVGDIAWFETVREAISVKAAVGNSIEVDDESLYDL